ncbi:hypothetical protein [Couchioplanes azureus]|uniref:hypothetical protein n=1 Tax=Couchioplanes caeruleus TaxID=56438 RepID=UPI001670A1AE|nr:hypothetical protein [Couchioplanes caeruleus]GGQ84764.1 hypothetical protein GCM10010166_63740 [Couchioplanes caeruleus subsp. azureus]
MINPGTVPIDDAREDLAVSALDVFLTAVQARAAELEAAPLKRRIAGITGEAKRDPAADRDGRFGWDLPLTDGRIVRLLLPGVPVELARDSVEASSPCLYVNGTAWWWSDAVNAVAAEGLVLDLG